MPYRLTVHDPDPAIAALADRLPDFQPRASFPEVHAALRGVIGRNDLYALLRRLDGAHVHDDLILRIADHERAARRLVVVRPRLRWDAQREYLRRFRLRGGAHPPAPISYKTAHARVRDERGPASALSCDECGDRATEWSYGGFGLDEQVGTVAGCPALWSPDPADYDPLCSRCHWERDESGVLWGDAPLDPEPLRRRPSAPRAPLPPDAPAWVRALVSEAANR